MQPERTHLFDTGVEIPEEAFASKWLHLAERWISARNENNAYNEALQIIADMLRADAVRLFSVPVQRAPATCLASFPLEKRLSSLAPNVGRSALSQMVTHLPAWTVSDVAGGERTLSVHRAGQEKTLWSLTAIMERTEVTTEILEIQFHSAPDETTTRVARIIAAFTAKTWQSQTPLQTTQILEDQSEQDNILGVKNKFNLSPSETRVCAMIKEGKSPAEIAQDLGLSVETIRSHLKNAFVKTETSSQRELLLLLLKPNSLETA